MKNFKLLLSLIVITIVITGSRFQGNDEPAYKNKNLPISERVADLIKKMTLEEKIIMLGGTGFATNPIERLGIPELKMADGPLGVRIDKATAFPSGIAMASTWNPELIELLGSAIGRETRGKGRDVILAPCVNIARIPQGGRNFESFGEDPFLTSRFAVAYIKGVQNENVAATVKHFAVNNQEYERDFVNVIIDERALNEIYLPSFKAAVQEANVLAVMSSYNKVNGPYASENDYLLVEKLKKEWGFQGLVMSDWGAVHSSIPTFNCGLDLEMPDGKYLNMAALLEDIKSGKLSEDKLNDKVSRILTVMFKLGLFEKQNIKNASLINNETHKNVAYDVEKEGIVLLKNNNNILPINKEVKSIAVIGPNGNVARTGGGGSSMVSPYSSVSILQGLINKLGDKVKIEFQPGVTFDGDAEPIANEYFYIKGTNKHGLQAEYFDNMDLTGSPILKRIDNNIFFKWGGGSPAKEIKDDNFSVRWVGELEVPKSGEYTFDGGSDDGIRLFIDNNLVINDWSNHAYISAIYKMHLEKGKRYSIKLEYFENGGDAAITLGWRAPEEDISYEAIELAKNSELVILCLGTSSQYETEGKDRKDLILPNGQDELVKKILKVNKNVVVVLITGSPVLMNEWIDDVDAVVETWFGGEQLGNATADVLLGDYNPSGKLPVTFPKKWEDCSAFNTYMKKDSVTEYSDGLYVGYRHFDKYNIEPLFHFGYGLSYTTFKYDNLTLSNSTPDVWEAEFTLTNTGKVEGTEIVQLYINDEECSVDRPEKELKGFNKVILKPGETKTVSFKVDKKMLSFYDVNTHDWKFEPGKFNFMIGSSSNDIRLKDNIIFK